MSCHLVVLSHSLTEAESSLNWALSIHIVEFTAKLFDFAESFVMLMLTIFNLPAQLKYYMSVLCYEN